MRVIDLFCGAGGFSEGFRQAGFDILAGYDNDRKAQECYGSNLDAPCFLADLSDTGGAIYHAGQWRAQVVIGGPPCQDFSTAGNRQEGKKAALTPAFAAIAGSIGPQVIVMENVPAARHSGAYCEALDILERHGYHLEICIINAADCGMAQRRKRLFTFGLRQPPMVDLSGTLTRPWQPRTIRDVLTVAGTLDTEHVFFHPARNHRRGVFSVDGLAPVIRANQRRAHPKYIPCPNDSADPSEARKLTVDELAALQGFPPNWYWPGPKTADYTLVGNAVPPPVARRIAETLLWAGVVD